MSAGKGSAPRNCFSKSYRENFDQIFAPRRRAAENHHEENELVKLSALNDRPPPHPARTVAPYPIV
jgi:hypothetical protein